MDDPTQTEEALLDASSRVQRGLVVLAGIGLAHEELQRARIDVLIEQGRVVENDDGSLTYHLDYPIKLMGDTVEELTFGRVNMGQVKEMHRRQITGDERAEALYLLTGATYTDGKGHTTKLIDKFVDTIDASEIGALEIVSRFFLHRTRRLAIGGNASGS